MGALNTAPFHHFTIALTRQFINSPLHQVDEDIERLEREVLQQRELLSELAREVVRLQVEVNSVASVGR